VLLRTGGTTGPARRLVRTTDSWVDSFPAVSDLAGLGPGSRMWVPGPASATMNLFARVHADLCGVATAHSPAEATHVTLTPAQLARRLRELAPGTTVVTAGDRLSPALRAQAEGVGLRVCHYYGAAELSFVAWGGDADHLAPFPGVTVESRAGELWVRSPFVFDRYDGPPGPLRRSPDGFATVGDRGRVEDGRVAVAGRPGSVTTGGATVSLAEVEAALRVEGEVVVLAVPHPDLGAVVVAVLTDPADHPRMRRRAREQLSAAARPRRWLHAAAVPTTSAGKVDRERLTALAADDDDRLRPLV
jgi:long-chain acyl-CoA synthetase